MSIYKRINKVQCNLMQKELPKTGYNKYQGFHYYELEDILPTILSECSKQELYLHFSFTEDTGYLTVYDYDGKNHLSTTVPLPCIKEIIRTEEHFNFKKIKNDLIQAQGSYMTYAKRYLLINMFHICEEDHIDMFNKEDIPEPVKEAKRLLEEKGVEPNRMNLQSVITFTELSPSERKETIAYIKTL